MGWSPEANYSLLNGKAWLTSHFEEAAELECFHQAYGLSHSHNFGWLEFGPIASHVSFT
ncbi:hypothetical protein E5676_scaffold600G00500 [Cucumis melo var. makuwa]|uniref:Uncharacterized protein n=1 Tax=Cucumis melo var. makuwa TaxID=1194695 RepID=A0A5D3DYD0_CUCMM|nr:hypothetical protein E6C27_scaffold61G00480 [Cucumis melo var. makuwa]TYK28250.1 hypothetical protein E5676_scaffold600G00500 [Cucumis melo var. makuwa]